MDIPDMQHQVMGYDRSATMFSPDGHILQVEYADKTTKQGRASIGLNCKDGVVIIADKGIRDSLIIEGSIEKIYEIDSHIMASAAGILSDARVLINQTRIIAQQHHVTYDTSIDTESIIREVADIQQQYTQHPGVRPFGVALIIAGRNNKKTQLFTSDITGNYFEYGAVAIGEHDSKIKELLRKKYKKEISTKEGIQLGFDIFKDVLKSEFDINRFNVSFIKNDSEKITKMSRESIAKYE